MPQKRRDFRRRRQPGGGIWPTIKFILMLAFLGVLSFVVGALVISRLMLPRQPAKNDEDKPPRRSADASRLPAPAFGTSDRSAEQDTIVEQVAPGSRSDRERTSSHAPGVPPEPQRRSVAPTRSDEPEPQPRPDSPRVRRRASKPSTRSETRQTPPERDDRRRTRTRSEERPRARVSEPEPPKRETRSAPEVRKSPPRQRERVRRPAPSPPRRSEGAAGGIQRSESIPD